MAKKIILSVLFFMSGGVGLVFYDMATMDIETLILCSASEGGIRIPAGLCEYYMLNYRAEEEDIKALSEGAGLDFVLNLESGEKYLLAEEFIARGLDVNGVNHYSNKDVTPLHSAVLYNDVRRVRFLIEQGADVDLVSDGYGMNALELAKALDRDSENENRDKIIEILEAAVSE